MVLLVGEVWLAPCSWTMMIKEQDFKMPFEPVFFSTSQVDQLGPDINGSRSKLKDAMSIPLLEMDIINCPKRRLHK